MRRLDFVAVYGRAQGTAIFELLGMTGEANLPPAWVADYERGLDHYAARNWQAAIDCFARVIALRGADIPSEIFLERCRSYALSPPSEDWTPLVALDAK